MCKPNMPAQPEAPDYAKANREAVMADIETLPLRRYIEAQARLGQGEFEGMGDAELAAQLFRQQLQQAPEAAAGLLQLQRDYGVDFAKEARRQLEATDPEGFRLRQQFGDRLLNGRNSIEEMLGGLNLPDYEQVGNVPTLADDAATADARARVQGQIYDDLARVGTMDPALQRAAEQAARARGSASGNILGDGAALKEALSVQLAQRGLDQDRQNRAISLMQSGQSVGDKANQFGQANFANSLEAIAQRNNAKQQTFAGQQSNAAQRQGARQQDLANIQSFLGLQPIVSQGGQLAGLQQGAAPFVQGGYNGANINNNAGALGTQFAAQNFGTQANMFGTAADFASQNSFVNNFSKVAGALGSLGQGVGAMRTCHVARLVYGDTNPDWVRFFIWKETTGPVWFRRLYNRYSVKVAELLKPFPKVQKIIRRWMDYVTKES